MVVSKQNLMNVLFSVGKGSSNKSVSLWECSTEKIKLLAKTPLTTNGTGLAFLSHKTFVTGGDDSDNQLLQVLFTIHFYFVPILPSAIFFSKLEAGV